MNALNDPSVIQALYKASCAGVKIKLLVRGICALRPGVKGVSENIKVYSVVGRFLEHSRVYVFGSGRDRQVFISSADWMPRNLYHRVEVAVPVLDASLKSRVVRETLDYYFKDNQFAWLLQSSGRYKRRKTTRKPVSAQAVLMKELSD
jgi:polyphosphate kinase